MKLPTLELEDLFGRTDGVAKLLEEFQRRRTQQRTRNEQKFDYLIDVLKGDALKEVKCLSLTAASYAIAIDLLNNDTIDQKLS